MKRIIEYVVFQSKWLLIPFYIVLIMTLAVYTYFDVSAFVHYLGELHTISRDGAMLTFIELIDLTMIANLGKMIITGSYNSFISKSHGNGGENVSSGMLKVKMATSLVGITSINLLSRSVDVTKADWDTLYKLAFVHGIFLISALVLEIVDYLHEKVEKMPETSHH